VFVGDNLVARGLGEHYPLADVAQASLPAKVAGVHRWIVTCGFVVERPGLLGRDDVRMMLGPSTMFHSAIGCWDCEQAWDHDTADKPCPNVPLDESSTS
jgi:hypothetical protein